MAKVLKVACGSQVTYISFRFLIAYPSGTHIGLGELSDNQVRRIMASLQPVVIVQEDLMNQESLLSELKKLFKVRCMCTRMDTL